MGLAHCLAGIGYTACVVIAFKLGIINLGVDFKLQLQNRYGLGGILFLSHIFLNSERTYFRLILFFFRGKCKYITCNIRAITYLLMQLIA